MLFKPDMPKATQTITVDNVDFTLTTETHLAPFQEKQEGQALNREALKYKCVYVCVNCKENMPQFLATTPAATDIPDDVFRVMEEHAKQHRPKAEKKIHEY